MSDVFYCPTDEDSFDHLGDAMNFLGNICSSREDAIGSVIDVHKKLNPTHGSFVDGQSILENIASSAYDEYSEYADDYLSEVIYDKNKAKELEELITDWLNKNAEQPSFYGSAGKVDSITVTGEMLDDHKITF